MLLVLKNRIREMLTLHTNPHAVHGRFTLKDNCERQFWNGLCREERIIDRCITWAINKCNLWAKYYTNWWHYGWKLYCNRAAVSHSCMGASLLIPSLLVNRTWAIWQSPLTSVVNYPWKALRGVDDEIFTIYNCSEQLSCPMNVRWILMLRNERL